MRSVCIQSAISSLPLAVLFVLGSLPSQRIAPETLELRAFDRQKFESHMRGLGCTDRQLLAFRDRTRTDGAKDAVDDLLRSRFPAYRDAVRFAEDQNPRAALKLVKVLQSSDDRYVRAFTRYQLGRVLLEGDDPESAVAIFEDFLAEDLNKTPLNGEVLYCHGMALAIVPERGLALRSLSTFLSEFLEAPERLRSSAAQVKAELERREGVLHDLSDAMGGVRRDIRRTNTGEKTQRRQREVIERLQELIDLWEKQESQGGGAPGGSGNLRPATESGLPGGDAGLAPRGPQRRTVGQKWGAIRPEERAAIETELRTRLSARYRQMLKSYYGKLARSGR
jgi:hypothetical protein